MGAFLAVILILYLGGLTLRQAPQASNARFTLDSWSPSSVEALYGFSPASSNSTITYSGVFTLVLTNLTAITTGRCAGQQQPRFGAVDRVYKSRVLFTADVYSTNNTTTRSNESAGESDAAMQDVHLFGPDAPYTMSAILRDNVNNGSKAIR